MRLISTLHDLRKGRMLSDFLTQKGIENRIEIFTNTDWGSNGYGDSSCKIWVINEEDLEASAHWAEEFTRDPDNPMFVTVDKAASLEDLPPRIPQEKITAGEKSSSRSFTLYFLLLCCLLFGISSFTSPLFAPYPSYLPPIPLFSSPIKKELFYDYPKAYEIVDQLVELYGLEKLQNPEDLPPEGKHLVQKFLKTPYWKGYYDHLVDFVRGSPEPRNQNAPLFEKIREGEVWRIFTPCLLHSDLLHLFFNMIWLLVLGRQMENKIGQKRYLLFIIITGILSNTAQYLMSGPNFIGFSGILCAMLTFIWARQKKAPWEGYQLQKSTMNFMMFFIFSMFGLQLVSFYLEAFEQKPFPLIIANTAHLSGALCGYILGKIDILPSN